MVELTGADIFVRCLRDEGVEHVFGYPGGVRCTFTTPCTSNKRSSTYWCATNKARPTPPMVTPAPPVNPESVW